MTMFHGSLRELVTVIIWLGGFCAGVAAIRRYIAKPINKFVEELREWRSVPQDLHELKTLFTEHIAQTEERLTAVEPPHYRRRVSL